MPTLKRQSTGPEVTKLQQRLKDLGFDPKGIDETFGKGTEDAVKAFQQANHLEVDGKVGDDTRKALQLDDAAAPDAGSAVDETAGGGAADSSPMPNVTVAIVRRMFPDTRVSNIETHLPIVLQALVDADLGDKDMVLMALGTIRAETAGFVPISEGISHFNTSGKSHPFDKYDHRDDLGNRGPMDGPDFKGRGFVQLTGRANYKEHGEAIGLGNQLIDNPDLANQPDIAAKLLASFIKSKEHAIRNALAGGDLAEARKLVNGGSHGLDEFKAAFNTGKSLL
jgi:peptidoglycan hydrolase-like protein with peptidoglycan-binding domain